MCLQNWAEMQFPIINLAIFLLLAAVDIGTAVYTRYALQEDSKVLCMEELDLVNHLIVVLRLCINWILTVMSPIFSDMAGNSSGDSKFCAVVFLNMPFLQ